MDQDLGDYSGIRSEGIIISMTKTQSANAFESFQWSPQPAAFGFVRLLAGDFLAACPEAAAFADRMRIETGTRFFDWIDHIRVNARDPKASQLERAGYCPVSHSASYTVFVNDRGVFPPILVWDGVTEIAIKVESVVDFLAANQLQREVLGSPLAALRTCRIYGGQVCAMTIVERHGTRGFDAEAAEPEHPVQRLIHMEKFRTRRRDFEEG